MKIEKSQKTPYSAILDIFFVVLDIYKESKML